MTTLPPTEGCFISLDRFTETPLAFFSTGGVFGNSCLEYTYNKYKAVCHFGLGTPSGRGL